MTDSPEPRQDATAGHRQSWLLLEDEIRPRSRALSLSKKRKDLKSEKDDLDQWTGDTVVVRRDEEGLDLAYEYYNPMKNTTGVEGCSTNGVPLQAMTSKSGFEGPYESCEKADELQSAYKEIEQHLYGKGGASLQSWAGSPDDADGLSQHSTNALARSESPYDVMYQGNGSDVYDSFADKELEYGEVEFDGNYDTADLTVSGDASKTAYEPFNVRQPVSKRLSQKEKPRSPSESPSPPYRSGSTIKILETDCTYESCYFDEPLSSTAISSIQVDDTFSRRKSEDTTKTKQLTRKETQDKILQPVYATANATAHTSGDLLSENVQDTQGIGTQVSAEDVYFEIAPQETPIRTAFIKNIRGQSFEETAKEKVIPWWIAEHNCDEGIRIHHIHYVSFYDILPEMIKIYI